MKNFLLKWKIQIAHFAISLVISFLWAHFSGRSFWGCFLIVEFSLIANGYLATWEDMDPEDKDRVKRPLKNFFKWTVLVISIVGIMGLGLYTWDVSEDRSYSIEIKEDTKLFADYTASFYSANPVEVKAGEKLKVLRTRNPKHFMTVQVEKENGESGWLIAGPEAELRKRGSEK